MTYKKWFPTLIKELKNAYTKVPELSESHNIDHILRVWETVEKLGKKLNADMEVLIAATLLHDLGRHYPRSENIHGPKSAQLAKPILNRIKFPKKKINKVLEAIALHDFQTKKSKRKSIESKILFDADKIDFFGVVGIARTFAFFSRKGKDIPWITNANIGKPKRIENRYNGLHFKESKELVKGDFKYMVNFFKKLKEEIK